MYGNSSHLALNVSWQIRKTEHVTSVVSKDIFLECVSVFFFNQIDIQPSRAQFVGRFYQIPLE